ncbi:hypothetical protein [Pseudonocardia yuanmonensis]|uniref:hypothetical protein n=1 Tax=Pseudonocardia yuanmonensis TaxID=1095914 RepID=UPI0031F1A858
MHLTDQLLQLGRWWLEGRHRRGELVKGHDLSVARSVMGAQRLVVGADAASDVVQGSCHGLGVAERVGDVLGGDRIFAPPVPGTKMQLCH